MSLDATEGRYKRIYYMQCPSSNRISIWFKGPFINNVRIRGEGRGLAYLVKLIKEQRGRGSKNALFARTLFMNGP